MGKQSRKGQKRTASHPHHKTGEGNHHHHQLYSGSHTNHSSSSSVSSSHLDSSTKNDSQDPGNSNAEAEVVQPATEVNSKEQERETTAVSSILMTHNDDEENKESGRLSVPDDEVGDPETTPATDPLAAASVDPEVDPRKLNWTTSYVEDRTEGIRALIAQAEEKSSEFFDCHQDQQQHNVDPATEPLLNGNETSNDKEEGGQRARGPHSPSTLSTQSPTTRQQQSQSSILNCCQNVATNCCNSSFLGAVVNLCSATLGAGVLSLPHACAQAGLVSAAIVTIVAAAATVVSIRLLVRACTFYQLYTYESLTEVLYGRRLRTAVELGIVVFCQGCAVAYLIAVADILQQAHLLFFQSRSLSMLLIWACVLLPLSLLRTMTALQLSSAVGIASIGTLVFAAIIHLLDDERSLHEHTHHHQGDETENTTTIMDGRHLWSYIGGDGTDGGGNSTDDDNTSHDVDWSAMLWPQNGAVSVLTACPIFLFAFSCQVNVCAIYEELPPPPTAALEQPQSSSMPDKERLMRRVAAAAVAVCAALYAGVSLATLADFGADGVTPNILNAYPQPLQGIMQVAAAGMVLAVTMAFPLNIFPARVTLDGICEESECNCCCWGGREDESGNDNSNRNPVEGAIPSSSQRGIPSSSQRGIPSSSQRGIPSSSQRGASSSSRANNNNLQRGCCRGNTRCGSFWNRCCTRRRGPRRPNPALTAALLEEELSRLEDALNRHHMEAQEASALRDNASQADDDEDNFTNDGDGDENDDAPFPWLRHIVLTLALAGSALGIALVAPDISVVFQIVGGTASSGLGFCVPGLLGLRLGRDLQDGTNGSVTCVSWLLLYGGALVGALTTAVTIYQIATGR